MNEIQHTSLDTVSPCKPLAQEPESPFEFKGQRRILVIDDNPSIHDDFRKVLDESGEDEELGELEAELFGEFSPVSEQIHFDVSHAYQGQEGLQFIEKALSTEQPFDMAFVDMRMPPGWDGLQTIENLWKVDPDLQVVICSAYSDYPLSEIRRRLGLTDKLLILKKPFDNSEVCQLAATLTEKRRLARQANMRMNELQQMVEERTQKLRRLSRVDCLTDVLNRRGIYEEVERHQGQLDRACILMIDVDSFKHVNDQFGHNVGDEVLTTVSQSIRAVVRKSDIAGRFGGDEFVVILPGADVTTGETIAETLRQVVATRTFCADENEFTISLSIGVAAGSDEFDLIKLLAEADEALYVAKADGRNAVRSSRANKKCETPR